MRALLDIGDSLVRARRARGMSQRELGERVGTSQQQVARWEAAGYRSASLERVAAVARALGLESPVVPSAALPFAAEAPASYIASRAAPAAPVRDLGEIAARIRQYGDVFRDRYHLERIGVFGSFACGEQTAESDVDLLVETANPGGLRFVEAANFAQEILGREVDFVRPQQLRERLNGRVLGEAVYVWSA